MTKLLVNRTKSNGSLGSIANFVIIFPTHPVRSSERSNVAVCQIGPADTFNNVLRLLENQPKFENRIFGRREQLRLE